jgi:SSS family transporter
LRAIFQPGDLAGLPPNINIVDLLTLGAYVGVLCAISLYHSRKLKTQDDVLLAGRSMSRWPIALSMYMALFSTNTFVALTGWMNKSDGTIWIGLRSIGMMLAVPLIVYLYPSLFFRLRISTAYEYLEKRFDYRLRAFAGIFFLAARVMWMATMLYSSGLVLSMLLGWTADFGWKNQSGQLLAMSLVAALGTFFALAGGMHAVIWTDVVQFFILMGGVITMGVYAAAHSGGLAESFDIAANAGKFNSPELFSLTSHLSLFSALLLGFTEMLSSSGSDQVVLQTYLTARSEEEAKKSLWRNGLVLKPLSLIFPLLGLLMFVYYEQHADVAVKMRVPDDALSVFVVHVLPQGLRGLVVVAILSAVVDSVASGMAASSAVVQVDFVRRFRTAPLSDRGAVRLARALILTWGVLITLVGLWIQRLGSNSSIIDILNMVMYPFSSVLLGVFLLGLLSTRATARGTFIGAAIGFLLTISLSLAKQIFSQSELSRISSFYFGPIGVVATVIAGRLCSLADPPPQPGKIQGLTKRHPPGASE